jgi:hypothetical protein
MPIIPQPQSVWTTTGTQAQMPPSPIEVVTNPTAFLTGVLGQQVINTANQTIWEYTGSQWLQIEAAGGGGVFASLTVNPGPTAITGAVTVTSGGNATNIANDAGGGAVNLGTAGARAVTVGSVTALASTTIQSGTGGGSVTSTGLNTISSSLNNNNAVNITASDPAGGIVLSAANGTIVESMLAAGVTYATTNLPWTLTTGTQTVGISTDNTSNTVHIGTGGAASLKTVVVGCANNASVTTLQGGTGGTSVTSTAALTLTSPAANGVQVNNGGQAAGIYVGTGAPTVGPLVAPQGSLYMNIAGNSTSTRLYVASDSVGGWTNVTTAA